MIVSSQEDERLYWREHDHVTGQSSQRLTYRTGMRDMGGYLISITWVGNLVYFGNFISGWFPGLFEIILEVSQPFGKSRFGKNNPFKYETNTIYSSFK